MIWEATRACALACRHCRASAVPGRDQLELNTEEADDLMRQVAAFGKPPPIFVITGGDPFERPDLTEIIRRGRAHGLPVAVSPSGTAKLNRESLAAVRDAGAVAVSLSIDGSTAEVHDGFRGIPGTFDRTMAAWREARDLGLKVQVNTTVTRRNVRQLPRIAEMIHELGAMTWSAFMLVPTGRGADLGPLTAAETEDVLNFLYDVGRTVPVRTTEGHHFRRVVLQRRALEQVDANPVSVLGLGELYQELSAAWQPSQVPESRAGRRPPLNVSAGSGFVFISHRGTVHPSGFFTGSAGNVREGQLADIYRDSELFVGMRDPSLLRGRCGSCEYAIVCGGSRSRALAATGDALAEDPLCVYVPGSFPYADEVRELLDASS